MLELDGGIYPFVKTTKENTDDIVDFINSYATEHNISVSIDKNKANTLYMMLFGIGYLSTILQKLIRSAADSNSIQNSSAKQLDLIAETMHTSRKKATYSIVDCIIAYELNLERPSILLDDNTYFTVQRSDGRVMTFIPVTATLLDGEAGSYSKTVQFKCTEAGPVYIKDNVVSNFSKHVDGVLSISNRNCVKGAYAETTEQLRTRLQRRAESNSRMDRCAMALTDLQGVSKASVLFNPSVDEEFNIIVDNDIQIEKYQEEGYGPFIVPPRKACVFISGNNDDVAVTFFNHMICLTSDRSNIDNAFTMKSYVTRSGQIIPFYYTRPIEKQINVYVYTLNPVSQEVSDNIKDTIATMVSDLNIGQSLSDGEIIKKLYSLYPDLDITGVSFTYHDYYMVACNASDVSALNNIMGHLNSAPDCVPGYEDSDSVYGGVTVKLYSHMIINVLNDEDQYNVPYVITYDAAAPDDKWSSDKYYSAYPKMMHENVHSVIAYPYELIQVNTADEQNEHILVIVGRV